MSTGKLRYCLVRSFHLYPLYSKLLDLYPLGFLVSDDVAMLSQCLIKLKQLKSCWRGALGSIYPSVHQNKHFKNDKLNIKKLKHLGLWWFELCVCLIKTGFSHFPSWTVCICICVCLGFLAFPVEMFVFVCARVFLLSLLNCLYLYLHLLRLSYFPSWSDCICICKCSGFITICICMCSGFLSLSVEVPKKKEACPSLAQTHPRWACWF